MWLLVFLLLPIAVIVFIQMNKNGNNQNKGTSSGENSPREINSIGKLTPSADKPSNPRQNQIDRDKEIARKIFIYGGGACLVLLIAGIIFALNPNMGTLEKTEKLMSIGVPVVLVLGLIGLGSVLPNKSSSAPKSTSGEKSKKADDFYKPYFIDNYGHTHYPTDHNFKEELLRYSDHNARYYNVTFKEHEADMYIVDGHGNTVKIYNESVIIIRDDEGNYCKINLK